MQSVWNSKQWVIPRLNWLHSTNWSSTAETSGVSQSRNSPLINVLISRHFSYYQHRFSLVNTKHSQYKESRRAIKKLEMMASQMLKLFQIQIFKSGFKASQAGTILQATASQSPTVLLKILLIKWMQLEMWKLSHWTSSTYCRLQYKTELALNLSCW